VAGATSIEPLLGERWHRRRSSVATDVRGRDISGERTRSVGTDVRGRDMSGERARSVGTDVRGRDISGERTPRRRDVLLWASCDRLGRTKKFSRARYEPQSP
jgi:hypothetical protein